MRLKIFIFVGLLFGITISGVIALRYLEVDKSIHRATDGIMKFVKKLDYEKRKAVLEYLAIAVTEKENQIDALFRRINEFKWPEERFAASTYNYDITDWKSSSILMMTNQWIDLIQTIDQGKLTSSIVARPAYLENFVCIPFNEVISVVLTMNLDGEIIPYIAVPYWTPVFAGKEGITKGNQILFLVKEFLEMKGADLQFRALQWYSNSLDTSVSIESNKTYIALMENVIQSIQIVQTALKQEKELIRILTTKGDLEGWIKGKVKSPLKEVFRSEDICRSYVCDQIESTNKAVNEGWNSRYEQNTLIWKLGELTGSGIWNYNPLDKMAPLGICSFLLSDLKGDKPFYKGKGILAREVFLKEPFVINYECKTFSRNACISKNLDVIAIPERGGVFLTNTMVYKKGSATGTITVGMGINRELQKLALAAPGGILFVTSTGEQIFFNENGNVSNQPIWKGIDFSKLVEEKSGVIKDIGGQEFLFVHLTPILNGRANIFVIEFRQDVFKMLLDLKEKTVLLMHRLLLENGLLGCIAIVIGLLVLNQILKKGIAPLTALATTTKLIALGQLENIHIPEIWKKRKDEVGVLCLAFDQMVEEMKEGIKVKAILNKVVSKEIAAKILKDGVQLGGEIRDVTILFADIRHFTHITEHMPPQDVLEMLNSCLTILSRVIDDHEGVIDKYIGDEIMAIFGAPVDTHNPAFQAVQCAKTMIEVLSQWNEMRKMRNLPELSIGISVHTGSVIAGNIGAENHLSYTVLGHAVNMASRIADHAAPMEILITEGTLNAPNVRENTPVKPLPPVPLKGISKPVPLYRVLL